MDSVFPLNDDQGAAFDEALKIALSRRARKRVTAPPRPVVQGGRAGWRKRLDLALRGGPTPGTSRPAREDWPLPGDLGQAVARVALTGEDRLPLPWHQLEAQPGLYAVHAIEPRLAVQLSCAKDDPRLEIELRTKDSDLASKAVAGFLFLTLSGSVRYAGYVPLEGPDGEGWYTASAKLQANEVHQEQPEAIAELLVAPVPPHLFGETDAQDLRDSILRTGTAPWLPFAPLIPLDSLRLLIQKAPGETNALQPLNQADRPE